MISVEFFAMLMAVLFLFCIALGCVGFIISKYADIRLYRKYRRDCLRMRHIVKSLRDAKRHGTPAEVEKALCKIGRAHV